MVREMEEDSGFPPGWDEARVRRLLEHYESQTDVDTNLAKASRLRIWS